jgi:Fic family protein
MNISHYKSGSWDKQFQHKSFAPELINHEWLIDNADIQNLLSAADIKLGELNAFSQLVPDVDFFIRMHIRKEATTSSRIEGTQTNMEEIIQKKENIDPEKRDDWQEVQNYIKAMNKAIKELETLPLSGRLIKNTHRILLEKSRGNKKTPGEYRRSQNWIGGASLNDAVFIPPNQERINELMSDLEQFIYNEKIKIPHLIKIAFIHYQFETIHPFLDGNGRIGRLLITLYLVDKKLLVKPTLYLSHFFEKNKAAYYDNLMRVRTHNNMEQWLKFFLEGVRQTSENSIQTFKKIIKLKTKAEHDITSLGKKVATAKIVLQHLYAQPIVDMTDLTQLLQVNKTTTSRLIDDFEKLGILKEITGYKRNRIFSFEKYINLFND